MTPKPKNEVEMVTVSIRFPSWLYQWLTGLAKTGGRSYNQQVIWMLTNLHNAERQEGKNERN